VAADIKQDFEAVGGDIKLTLNTSISYTAKYDQTSDTVSGTFDAPETNADGTWFRQTLDVVNTYFSSGRLQSTTGGGASLSFDEVLLAGDEKTVMVGTPTVKGASVSAKIVDQVLGEKVRVAKFKAKARFRRATGFRSKLTKIEITGIKGGKE
jgi:large subunit ribosomal protein L21